MPLTNAQRKHLERRLVEERALITRALDRYEEDAAITTLDDDGDVSAAPTHIADLGTDNFQRELDASNAARQSQQLGEIDHALRKLYEEPERYGIDENTGEEIAFERLDVVPWARARA